MRPKFVNLWMSIADSLFVPGFFRREWKTARKGALVPGCSRLKQLTWHDRQTNDCIMSINLRPSNQGYEQSVVAERRKENHGQQPQNHNDMHAEPAYQHSDFHEPAQDSSLEVTMKTMQNYWNDTNTKGKTCTGFRVQVIFDAQLIWSLYILQYVSVSICYILHVNNFYTFFAGASDGLPCMWPTLLHMWYLILMNLSVRMIQS